MTSMYCVVANLEFCQMILFWPLCSSFLKIWSPHKLMYYYCCSGQRTDLRSRSEKRSHAGTTCRSTVSARSLCRSWANQPRRVRTMARHDRAASNSTSMQPRRPVTSQTSSIWDSGLVMVRRWVPCPSISHRLRTSTTPPLRHTRPVLIYITSMVPRRLGRLLGHQQGGRRSTVDRRQLGVSDLRKPRPCRLVCSRRSSTRPWEVGLGVRAGRVSHRRLFPLRSSPENSRRWAASRRPYTWMPYTSMTPLWDTLPVHNNCCVTRHPMTCRYLHPHYLPPMVVPSRCHYHHCKTSTHPLATRGYPYRPHFKTSTRPLATRGSPYRPHFHHPSCQSRRTSVDFPTETRSRDRCWRHLLTLFLSRPTSVRQRCRPIRLLTLPTMTSRQQRLDAICSMLSRMVSARCSTPNLSL